MENQLILLMVGDTGTGKTSSLRNMPLEKTVLVNVEQKTMLPFKGAKRLHKHWPLDNVDKLLPGLEMLEKDESIEYIVIDSLSFLLNMFEMQKVTCAANTQKAWGDYSGYYKQFIHKVKSSKKKFVILTHGKTTYDEKNMEWKTNAFSKGSLFGFIEADFNVVVYTDVRNNEDGLPEYRLLVKKTKETIGKSVKTPFGMFEEPFTKSNDVMEVFEAIKKYIEEE